MPARPPEKSIAFISPFGLPLLLDPPQAGPGGAERQFFLYASGLEEAGWKVAFITGRDGGGRDEKTSLPVHRANFSYLGGSKLFMLRDWLSILHAMWKAGCRYYVIKTPGHLLYPMSLFTRLFGRKLVFWAQMEFDAHPELRTLNRLPAMLQDMGVAKTDIVIAQNASQVEGFKKNYGKDAALIPNISGDLSGEGRTAPPAGRQLDVLWAGNSLPKKRYEVVLELASLLPGVSFAIAMNRADPARFESAQAACAAHGNVEFLGQVPPPEMEQWFARARIYLNTSTQEGFPNTYLQAWRCGTPVVSLGVDPDGTVTRNRLGIVLENRAAASADTDMAQLARQLAPVLEGLLSDQARYDELSANAAAYVEKHHGKAALIGRLADALCRA